MTDGVLLLDKPAGISSNVALQRVRRLYGWVKAGHTGTLDPLASGLLPVCLGEATKFTHCLLEAEKSYEAAICMGSVSSTGDAEGVIEPCAAPEFSLDVLERTLRAFIGTIEQLPPMHSALKRDGRPLYSYARAGEQVERKARRVVINEIHLIDMQEEVVRISVRCSKGTYIRVLAEDIGKALGCGAYLLGLRRSGIRDLRLDHAIALERLSEMDEAERLALLLPVDRLVESLPAVYLNRQASQRIQNGLSVSEVGTSVGAVRLYDAARVFLGIGLSRGDGTVVPKRLMAWMPARESSGDSRLSP